MTPFFTKIKNVHLSWYEIFTLAVLFIAMIGYVIFVKTNNSIETVYIKTDLSRADWWSNQLNVPSELLNNLKVGSIDQSRTARIIDIKYFVAELPDWEKERITSIGTIWLEIAATRRRDKLTFNDQELLVSNPLVLTIDNSRFELLITDIINQPPNFEYQDITLTVRIYDLRPEFYIHIPSRLTFYDNLNRPYGEITDMQLVKSDMVTIDQWGNPLLRKNPQNKDAIFTVRMKAYQNRDMLIGYDERKIIMGGQYIFNHPSLRNYDAWIIGIDTK